MAQFCKDAQISLGELIALVPENVDLPVQYDFADLTPTKPESYRGYYDHLALGWVDGEWKGLRSNEFRSWLVEARGAVYEGYKGGHYTMSDNTPMWVSEWGKVSDTIVTGVLVSDWRIVILTGFDS